ncbi:MAG: hypothetical protein ACOC7J_06250, partial [Armatimonadota bacterium]
LIQRQEGLAGGFYTGIATIDDRGRLHWRKVVGDCARLLEETDAADLPGATGLAHSRSKSGGDWRWSHPFIACDDRLAYIANGGMGYFEGRTDTDGAAQRLDAGGHKLTAVADEQIGKYPSLFGGGSVHVSDVMAHVIERRLDERLAPEDAIRQAFIELPAEIVGLFIAPAYPEQIFAARYTMPMCVTMDGSGARIASSPTAFGGRPDWWTWVPPFSTATVSSSRLEISPLECPEGPLPDDISRADARAAILEELAKGEAASVGTLLNAVKGFSARDELIVRYDPVYEVLFELLHEGAIEQLSNEVPGAAEDIPGTRFRFSLTDVSGEGPTA